MSGNTENYEGITLKEAEENLRLALILYREAWLREGDAVQQDNEKSRTAVA